MNATDLRAALDFFQRFQETQLHVWKFTLQPGVSWLDTVKKNMELRPLIEAPPREVVEVLHRPRKADDSWFAQHSSRAVRARTVFAAQAATAHGTPVVLLYTSNFLQIGAGLQERFTLTELDGRWVIVRREVRSDGAWKHAGGRAISSYVPTGALHRLVEPTDDTSKSILDGLT